MSSYHTTGVSKSYGHAWRRINGGTTFRLEWSIDVKVEGSRLRHPRTMTRDTDFAGAVRFAKKWGLKPPVAAQPKDSLK